MLIVVLLLCLLQMLLNEKADALREEADELVTVPQPGELREEVNEVTTGTQKGEPREQTDRQAHWEKKLMNL